MGSNSGSLKALKVRLRAKASGMQIVSGNGNIVAGGDLVIRDGAMTDGVMTATRAVQILATEDFDDGRIDALLAIADRLTITCIDARLILSVFDFDDQRANALGVLRDRIVDPDNWHVLLGVFDFDGARAKARALRPKVRMSTPAIPENTGSIDAPATMSPEELQALREQIELKATLVALEREAAQLAHERERSKSPWWVRLLRWLFGIGKGTPPVG